MASKYFLKPQFDILVSGLGSGRIAVQAQPWILIKDSHESSQLSFIPTEGGGNTSAKGIHIFE